MIRVYYGSIRHSVDGISLVKPNPQDPHKYGLPEIKKFPMPDAAHVKSAIKFFNYVEPRYEDKLARAILKRMKEYGITDVNVGPDNRFGKYYTPQNELKHHGILGQKWGDRNGPPYPLNPSDHSARERRAGYKSSIKSKKSEENKPEKKGLSDEEKKRLIAKGLIVTGVAIAAIGMMYAHKKGLLNKSGIQTLAFGDKLDLNSLSDEVLTISKNTKLQRMSTKSVEDYTSEGKSIFAAYEHRDKAIYKERMPDFFKRWEKKGIVKESTPYVHNMTLKRDLKITSPKAMADAYMKANKVNSIDKGRYTQFMSKLNQRDNPIVKEFVKELQAKGFDGVVDLNDAGVLAKKPLVIFNPGEVIANSKSHKLNPLESFINVITA